MSSEFRNVHAAEALLDAYIASNRNIALIQKLNISQIDRFDVWRCVFEKEREAYKILQEKELYSDLLKYNEEVFESQPKPDILRSSVAMFCITHLDRIVEWDSPLRLDEAIQIMVDVLGVKFIPFLLDEAKISVERRRKIIAPYFQKDDEWVNQAIKIQKAIEKIV